MTVGSRVASALIKGLARRSRPVTTIHSTHRPRQQPSRKADDLKTHQNFAIPSFRST